MFYGNTTHRQHVSSRGPLPAATFVALVAVFVIFILCAAPAFALTNGQALTTPFPRVSKWWPDSNVPLTSLATLDYVTPYEWVPMSPDLNRLAQLRALNPAQTIFADGSTCELNYRKPDGSGNPDGPATYDSERVGAVPSSWILKQVGSTLSASITTVVRPTQNISVADGSKFRAGNLVIIEDEKVLVVSVSGSTLTVRRGWAGSTAVNHAAGTRLAAAVASWPYSVKIDLTDECPLGRATGQIATPGTGTERGRDWMARRTAGHYKAAAFDGVVTDLGVGYISWFKGTGEYQFKSIASRSNPDVEVNYDAYNAKWAAGLGAFYTALRANMGPDAVILPNEATPAYSTVNGSWLENFPRKTTDTEEWHRRVIGPYLPQSPSYMDWNTYGRKPNFTTVMTYGDAPTDYQLMRYGLTTALMGDGFFGFDVGGSNQMYSFDEYDNAGAGKGYLGQPTGAMRSVVPALTSADQLGGNGAFSSAAQLNAWTLYSNAGSGSSKWLDNGTAALNVYQSTGDLGGVGFYLPNVPVSSGTHYTLSFRARSDSSQVMQAIVKQAASPWASYMATDEIPLTSAWKTYEIPMTASGSNSAAQVAITLGRSIGTVWIDDVKLQAGDRNVYRRDFDNGIALVNASANSVTVNLGGSFRKIKGTQAPTVNNGALVTAVTIPARDGLVLLRPEPAPNVAPVANANTYSTANATALTVAAPGVLGNDTDAEGSALTASVVTQPANGSLTLNANGGFTYTPSAGFSGTDTFTYRAYDGTAYSNAATVSIAVAAHAPTAVADSYSTQKDIALNVAAAGILANDSDSQGHTLTAVVATQPAHGTLTLNADGSFDYVPTAGYAGSDSFTYTVSDGSAVSAATKVSVSVIDPTANNKRKVYRFLNKNTGVHFYTASDAEMASVSYSLASTYQYEGVAYTLDMNSPANSAPLYRFYNKQKGVHFYTASEAEKANLINTMSNVYAYDGVVCNVSLGSAGTQPVYRFYNKEKGVHFYTASAAEKDAVAANLSSIYQFEGVAYSYASPL